MKGNAWLAGYFAFTALLVGGAGFFFYQGRSAFSEQFDGWDSLKGKIARLEKETPYPSPENEDQMKAIVTDYDGKVKALFESLDRYQKPLNTQMSDSEFANQVLKGKVAEFLKLAAEKGLEIDKKEEFYLGFDAYKTTFPRPEIVPAIGYQLDAINHLLTQLADSGVQRLRFLTRENLPGEIQAAPATPAAAAAPGAAEAVPATPGIVPGLVVQKYPITLRFVSTHAGFQSFVNRVANDKDYFFILRLLRVENSSPDGPALGGDDSPDGGPVFKKADGTTATRDEMDAKGRATLPFNDFVAAMTADGWQLQRQDARIIFGQETVEVFAVIDLVRFLPPDQVQALPAKGGAAKGTKKGSKR